MPKTLLAYRVPALGLIVVLGLAALFIGPRPAAAKKEGTLSVMKIEYGGWKNNLVISNGDAELIVTLDVGPRVISYKLAGGKNVFKEFADQMGKTGDKEWLSYGGHRLWIGPEDLTRTYYGDNGPVKYKEIDGGIRFTPGPETAYGMQKEIDVKLAPSGSKVTLIHRLTNIGAAAPPASRPTPKCQVTQGLCSNHEHVDLAVHRLQGSSLGLRDELHHAAPGPEKRPNEDRLGPR